MATPGLPNEERLITPHELKQAFEWIIDDVRHNFPPVGPGLPALTGDSREAWAENRAWLLRISPKNSELLDIVETAVMTFVLSDDEPQTEADAMKLIAIVGDRVRDIWADKSFTMFLFKNGFKASAANVSK
jgi:hypothetical protein